MHFLHLQLDVTALSLLKLYSLPLLNIFEKCQWSLLALFEILLRVSLPLVDLQKQRSGACSTENSDSLFVILMSSECRVKVFEVRVE